jgi:hypothetical protein
MIESIAGSMTLLGFIPFTLLGFAFAYLALRIRDLKAEQVDPQIGIKSALHYFLSISILVALTGATISAVDIFSQVFGDKPVQPNLVAPPVRGFPQQPMPQAPRNEFFSGVSQRIAWPLILSGGLMALGSLVLLKTITNDEQFPSVRRTFIGFRLVIAGMAFFFGFTSLVMLLFQKDLPSSQLYAIPFGVIFVWLPTLAVQAFLLKNNLPLGYYQPAKAKRRRAKDWEEEDEVPDEDSPRQRRRGRVEEEETPRPPRRPRRPSRDDEEDE